MGIRKKGRPRKHVYHVSNKMLNLIQSENSTRNVTEDTAKKIKEKYFGKIKHSHSLNETSKNNLSRNEYTKKIIQPRKIWRRKKLTDDKKEFRDDTLGSQKMRGRPKKYLGTLEVNKKSKE